MRLELRNITLGKHVLCVSQKKSVFKKKKKKGKHVLFNMHDKNNKKYILLVLTHIGSTRLSYIKPVSLLIIYTLLNNYCHLKTEFYSLVVYPSWERCLRRRRSDWPRKTNPEFSRLSVSQEGSSFFLIN